MRAACLGVQPHTGKRFYLIDLIDKIMDSSSGRASSTSVHPIATLERHRMSSRVVSTRALGLGMAGFAGADDGTCRRVG
jgi:hypothetical protein